MDPVRLKLDEENSLTFEVKIEGEVPSSAPIYRLVCEAGDLAYAFRGSVVDEGVQFNVPILQDKLQEGTYESHLEVVIENKLLIPLQFQVNFAVPTRVQVESVRVGSRATSVDSVPAAAAKLLGVNKRSSVADVRVETKAPATTTTKQTQGDVIQPAKHAKPIVERKKHLTLREMYGKGTK